MKIRSITYFCNPEYPLNEDILRQAGDFLMQAKAAFQADGYEVQTTRMATIPFPRLLGSHIDQLPRFAEELSRRLPEFNIAYVSLGPAYPSLPAVMSSFPKPLPPRKIFSSAA